MAEWIPLKQHKICHNTGFLWPAFSPAAVGHRCSSKWCSWKFPNIHRETSVFESLFNKAAGMRVFSYEYCEIFKNIFFIEHLWWLLHFSRITRLRSVIVSEAMLLWYFKLAQTHLHVWFQQGKIKQVVWSLLYENFLLQNAVVLWKQVA